MPRFFYIAKTAQAKTETGFLEAKDEQELARSLRQEGLFLVSVKKEDIPKIGDKLSIFSSGGASISDKLFFIRNLRVMVSAGVPLPRAIETLANQSRNKNFRKVLIAIKEGMIHGQSLSEEMKKHSNIFSEIFYNMIKIGEESGTLDQVLEGLDHQLEREKEFKSKVIGALIYPIVIVSAMVAIGFAMLIIVIPQLAETFAELELTLPFTTRTVIWLGTFLKKYWYVAPFIVAGLFFLIKALLRTKTGKRVIDKLVLKIPVISKLIRGMNSASFARTLSSLITAGVPLVRALEIIAGTFNNIYFKESLTSSQEQVKKGLKLFETLKPYSNLYLPIVIQMLEVGEETGETSQVLGQLATFLEEEISNSVKNIASLVEPLVMLVIGAAVGFFAISMIQPMYSMLEGI
ncbi:MAG: type II secretion system F family protein [bacterium]|nr:type II secretion system F family protein [bacterium]